MLNLIIYQHNEPNLKPAIKLIEMLNMDLMEFLSSFP